MRFALSAAAAASGLVLLMLAFFGQPEVYLRQVRQQWTSLMDTPPGEAPVIESSSPQPAENTAKLTELEQEVTKLKRELAARQALAEAERQILPTAPSEPPPALPVPDTNPGVSGSAAGTSSADDLSSPATRTAGAAGPVPPVASGAAPNAGPLQAGTPPIMAEAPPNRPAAGTPSGPGSGRPVAPRKPAVEASAAHQMAAPSAPPALQAPASLFPERREAPSGEAHDVPAGSPPTRASPPRPYADETQSVLARLRQASPNFGPSAGFSGPERDEPPPPPRTVSLPALRNLIASRSALAGGNVEEARRLLQEAQLQLVFRPVGAPGEDSPLAIRAASDVAQALEALSANDLVRSRNYIDRAVDVSSGVATSTPGGPPPAAQASGYAPAYPPR